MCRLLAVKGSSFGEGDLGDCGLLELRLVTLGELCGRLSDLGSNVVHSWLSLFRHLLEKLPSPGPTHPSGGSMSGGIWGEAGLRWDVEVQSRIVVGARGKGQITFGERCVPKLLQCGMVQIYLFDCVNVCCRSH